ncbi:MAG: pyridoxamine 5'-phosphate oxidase family protein [Candidatus Kariarchaeaceae archaeon]|jgi:general stress protein 26
MEIKVSKPQRPSIPEYGISEEQEGMVTWNQVNQWMDESKNYWISTTKPNGNPHARPLWGIWQDNFFYFGGGSKTQNAKNLQNNSSIIVHTESGENVVIIEGKVELFDDEKLNEKLGKAYEKRYGMFHSPPFWRVIPEIVFAWSIEDFASTPTKFLCTVNQVK